MPVEAAKPSFDIYSTAPRSRSRAAPGESICSLGLRARLGSPPDPRTVSLAPARYRAVCSTNERSFCVFRGGPFKHEPMRKQKMTKKHSRKMVRGSVFYPWEAVRR